MLFGEWLKIKRKEKRYTQKELGEILGVVPVYISRLETGKSDASPGRHLIEQLADLFDEDINRLTLMAGRLPQKLGDRIFEHQELFHRLCVMDESKLGEVEKFVLGGK